MADIKYHDPGEPVKCVVKECKAQFYRPQIAPENAGPVALPTPDIALLHGWRRVYFRVEGSEVELQALVCPNHTSVLDVPLDQCSFKLEG